MASTGTRVSVTLTMRLVPPKITNAISTVTTVAGNQLGRPNASLELAAMVLTWNPGNTSP